MTNAYMGNAFEHVGNFFAGARSKVFIKYTVRVLEAKKGLHAKKTFKGQALLVQERFGA